MTIKILDEDVVYFGGALSDDPLVAGMRISNRLLFGTATGGGGIPTVNVLLSGVSPLTLLNAVSLNYIKAFGKCEQDLTPTPTSPVDIVCNNGTIKAFCGNKWTDVNKLSGYIIQNQSGVIQANNNYNVSAPILLKAGDYSVSYYASATGARPFTIWECDAQGDLVGENYIFNITRPNVGTNTGTFTIDRDMYVRISWRNDFTDIVVAPTTAIIYYDGTVETVTTKQAFVNDTDVVDRTGLNSSNGATLSNANRCYVLFPCKAGVTYTAQTDTADLIGGNFIEYRQPSATSANFIKSITATDDGLVDGVYKFHATCDTDGWAGWQCKSNKTTAMENNWQITADTSSATCQPLLSVGDYKDVQNITNGAITRNVGIKVFDGTENWTQATTSLGVYRYRFEPTNAPKLDGGRGHCISTHFFDIGGATTQDIGGGFASTTYLYFIPNQDVDTVAKWTAFLADQYANGTPVIIVYPLATPTTETVTGQTLTITQGTNIVTAEGSVDDLELEISYKGYAELTVEEIEAVNTDESVEVIIS